MLSINHITQITISLLIFITFTPCCLAGLEMKSQKDSKECQASASNLTFKVASTQTDDSSPSQTVDKMKKTHSVKKKIFNVVSSAQRFSDACRAFDIELTDQEKDHFFNKDNSKANCTHSFNDFSKRNQKNVAIDNTLPNNQRDFMRKMKTPNSATRDDCFLRANNHFNNMMLSKETDAYFRGEFLLALFIVTHTAKDNQFSAKKLRDDILSQSQTSFYHGPFSHVGSTEVPKQLDDIHQRMGQSEKSLEHYQNTGNFQTIGIQLDSDALENIFLEKCISKSLETGASVTDVFKNWFSVMEEKLMLKWTSSTTSPAPKNQIIQETSEDYDNDLQKALKGSLEWKPLEDAAQAFTNEHTEEPVFDPANLKGLEGAAGGDT